LVGGEDARHDGVEVLPHMLAEGFVVEIERGKAPEVAPTRGEDLCAGDILGGEKQNDVAEDAIREVADTVAIRSGQRRHLCNSRRMSLYWV
jgi:hypothetical protein